MGFINNPVPRSLGKESKKAASILASFIKPNQVLGQEVVIPPHVLAEAQGLVVLTVLKAGFLFSGRAGSGVIVARLPDNTWSAPSAIVTAGAGVGGQVGAELTDFVFILNTKAAVDSFASSGSLTLGGNISLAAGPVGRNAEAAGTASTHAVSAVFAYSKTKGLFAGVSLEGSVLVARKDANRKFYGRDVSPRQILSGAVRPPPACEPLLRVLDARVFRTLSGYEEDYYYDDIPEFSDSEESSEYSRRGSRSGGGAGGRNGGGGGRGYGRSRGYDDDYYGEDDDDYDDYGQRRRPGRRGSQPYGGGDDDDFDNDRSYSSRRNGSSSAAAATGRSRAKSASAGSWRDDMYDDYPRRGGGGGGGAGGGVGRRTSTRGDNGYDDDISDLNNRMRRTGFSSTYSDYPKRSNSVRSNGGAGRKARGYEDDYEDDDYYDSRSRRRDGGGGGRIGGQTRGFRDDYEDRRAGGPRGTSASLPASVQTPIVSSTTGGGNANAQMKAVALYSFQGEQDGDLSFKKGDVINITKRSDSKDDWWTGVSGGREGIFPANYVDVISPM